MTLTPQEQEQAVGIIGSVSTFLAETEATNLTMQDVKDVFADVLSVLMLIVE